MARAVSHAELYNYTVMTKTIILKIVIYIIKNIYDPYTINGKYICKE